MRVLMISGDVSVIKGVDGPFTLTLTELSKYWDEIDVLCPGLHGIERQFSPHVHLKGVRKFFLFIDLIRILKNKKYDLIVCHDYGLMLNGLSTFFLAKFFEIPQISEIHHLEGFPIATNAREKFYAWWGKIYIRYFVRFIHAVRVDNQGDIVSLLKKLGVPEKKITYLPPIYLDLEIYKPKSQKKIFDILFVGRLAQNKGIFTILNAVKNLSTQGLKLKTNIKGRGPLKNEVLEFIRQNNLQDLVVLDERILSEPQMADLYNQAKVLICASTVEGGPRVTLEAMACEVTVISTGCGIMPEVIVDGRNGYLFDGSVQDLEDKIKNFFSRNNLHPQEIRNSILPYEYYKTLKNYGETYAKLIGHQKP